MGKVLSIDLAHTTIRNLGICLLEEKHGRIESCSFLKPSQLRLVDPPDAAPVAAAILEFCLREGIRVALLDGPQGWKSPTNGLIHSRACERILNTPAKTGTFGQVKPSTWTQFVKFSIAVFSGLIAHGATLASDRSIVPVPDRLLVLESFPFSAWGKLEIAHLPAKAKATPSDCKKRFGELVRRYGLNPQQCPSHDELQALVAGLGGIAILGRKHDGYVAEGVPPFQHEGHWVEGFIVNPMPIQ